MVMCPEFYNGILKTIKGIHDCDTRYKENVTLEHKNTKKA